MNPDRSMSASGMISEMCSMADHRKTQYATERNAHFGKEADSIPPPHPVLLVSSSRTAAERKNSKQANANTKSTTPNQWPAAISFAGEIWNPRRKSPSRKG